MTPTDCAPPASPELDIVVRELAHVSDRLLEAARIARSLSAATDWQARAAVAFHARAEDWAADVSGLGCLAETVRITTIRAREVARSRVDGWWCP